MMMMMMMTTIILTCLLDVQSSLSTILSLGADFVLVSTKDKMLSAWPNGALGDEVPFSNKNALTAAVRLACP